MSHPAYYMNLCGLKQDDEKIQNIPAPRMELMTHITLKTSQAFGFLGMGAAVPVSLIKGQRDLQSVQQRAFTYGKNGILAGLVVGPLISCAFMPGKSYDSIVDRCYRIRLNKGQVRADRFSILGLAVGMGAAHYLGSALEQGAVFGYVGGFLFGTIIHKIM